MTFSELSTRKIAHSFPPLLYVFWHHYAENGIPLGWSARAELNDGAGSVVAQSSGGSPTEALDALADILASKFGIL